MKHRLFIAVPLPDSVKQEISYAIDRLESQLPADMFRFNGPELWHITVSFLGDQDDSAFTGIINGLSQVILRPFTFRFTSINYGPSIAAPDMIWLIGDDETGASLQKLRLQVEELLIGEKVRFAPDNRPVTAHVTLARSRQYLKNVVSLEEPCEITVPVEELQLIESILKPSGPEYVVLNRFPVS